MSEELKPCPFCGGEMHLIGDMSDPKRAKLYRSQCKRCGCDLGGFLTEGLAIAAWNRRATPSPHSAAGEVERLRKALRMLMDAFDEVNLLGPNDGQALKRVGVAQVHATAALAQRAQEGR